MMHFLFCDASMPWREQTESVKTDAKRTPPQRRLLYEVPWGEHRRQICRTYRQKERNAETRLHGNILNNDRFIFYYLWQIIVNDLPTSALRLQ